MNSTTLSTMAKSQPTEPLLEHEIRLRAYDLYEQREQMDGHSVEDLTAALSDERSGAPTVIIARTVFGRGVPYMEQGICITQSHLPPQTINWHYLPMSEDEYAIALRELERQD